MGNNTKNSKKMDNQKFNFNEQSDEVKEFIAEKAETTPSLKFDGSRANGTDYHVIGAAKVLPYKITDENGEVKEGKYLGWECEEKTRNGNQVTITPNSLSAFTNNEATADWEILKDRSLEEAFKMKANSYEEQINEMGNWLNECGGHIVIIAKARHPRFKTQWIYAYAKA